MDNSGISLNTLKRYLLPLSGRRLPLPFIDGIRLANPRLRRQAPFEIAIRIRTSVYAIYSINTISPVTYTDDFTVLKRVRLEHVVASIKIQEEYAETVSAGLCIDVLVDQLINHAFGDAAAAAGSYPIGRRICSGHGEIGIPHLIYTFSSIIVRNIIDVYEETETRVLDTVMGGSGIIRVTKR